jgi:hypothetical protein
MEACPVESVGAREGRNKKEMVRRAYGRIAGSVCFVVTGTIPLCAIVKCGCVVTGKSVGHRMLCWVVDVVVE